MVTITSTTERLAPSTLTSRPPPQAKSSVVHPSEIIAATRLLYSNSSSSSSSSNSSSEYSDLTFMIPFSRKWYKRIIIHLATAIRAHLDWDDYLSQNIVECVDKIFNIDLKGSQTKRQEEGMKLFNELRETVVINPLRFQAKREAESKVEAEAEVEGITYAPLVEPMTDGMYWWEKGSVDQPWTLAHYLSLGLFNPPVSAYGKQPFDLDPPRPHLLAREIIAIMDAARESLGIKPSRVRNEPKSAPSLSINDLLRDPRIRTPAPTQTPAPPAWNANDPGAYFIMYMQKAQVVMDSQHHREVRRLAAFESHKVVLLRLTLPEEMRKELKKQEELVQKTRNDLTLEMSTMREELETKITGYEGRLRIAEAEVKELRSELCVVRRENQVHQAAIAALENSFTQRLKELETIKQDQNNWQRHKEDDSFCVIL